MPLVCEPAKFEDGPGLGYAYIGAFYPEPYQTTIVENVPFDRQVAGFAKRFPRNFVKPSTHYRKVVDTETGEIFSYAKWGFENLEGDSLFPQDRYVPQESIEATKAPYSDPEGLNDPLATWLTEEFERARIATLGERPSLRLQMMGTVPSAQGRGAGAMQVQWGIDFADKHGLPCWTEASPRSVRILKKLGFKHVSEIECPMSEAAGGGTYIFTCLVREPQTHAN